MVKVNRKHEIDPKNILKVVDGMNCALVYVKAGYPPVFKADCLKEEFLQRLVNLGWNSVQLLKVME